MSVEDLSEKRLKEWVKICRCALEVRGLPIESRKQWAEKYREAREELHRRTRGKEV